MGPRDHRHGTDLSGHRHFLATRKERNMQITRERRARIGARIIWLAGALLVVMVARPDAARAVTDDFSDLNDTANPPWTHLDGLVASTGQSWDASTGQYRMTAPNNGFSNLGFVGSYAGP